MYYSMKCHQFKTLPLLLLILLLKKYSFSLTESNKVGQAGELPEGGSLY